MTNCAVDGQPTADNATLCSDCTRVLEQALAELPALVDDLELLLSRQTAAPERHGGHSSDKPLPYDTHASAVLSGTKAMLVGWVQVHRIEGDPWPQDTHQSIARWLLARIERIRHHEAASDLYDELRIATNDMRQSSDLATYRSKFAVGPCINVFEDNTSCTGTIWAYVPADEARPAVMRCRGCGHEWPTDQWLRAGREILRKAS